MTDFALKRFTVYAKEVGRDPQVCRDTGGHWANPRMRRCNFCAIRLEEVDGVWQEVGT